MCWVPKTADNAINKRLRQWLSVMVKRGYDCVLPADCPHCRALRHSHCSSTLQDGANTAKAVVRHPHTLSYPGELAAPLLRSDHWGGWRQVFTEAAPRRTIHITFNVTGTPATATSGPALTSLSSCMIFPGPTLVPVWLFQKGRVKRTPGPISAN